MYIKARTQTHTFWGQGFIQKYQFELCECKTLY